ncbi:MAG: hypothetical protein IMZ64_05805 [Bacteroidetes bacterium]|nr:hypothetical protein [Bacteroidota bacterium]
MQVRVFLNNKLLSDANTKLMLSPQASDEEDIYGYGVWLCNKGNDSYYYFIQGSDPGVSFNSFVDIDDNIIATIVSNTVVSQANLQRVRQDNMQEEKLS